jgi:hypothetical protein
VGGLHFYYVALITIRQSKRPVHRNHVAGQQYQWATIDKDDANVQYNHTMEA